MKVNKEKQDAISKRLSRMRNGDGFGVELHGGYRIAIGCMCICDIEELGDVIKELQMLKEAIEEETGLII